LHSNFKKRFDAHLSIFEAGRAFGTRAASFVLPPTRTLQVRTIAPALFGKNLFLIGENRFLIFFQAGLIGENLI
jgi:hypothetical protein